MTKAKVAIINQQEYIILKNVTYNNEIYALLINSSNDDDIKIKKITSKDNTLYCCSLTSQEEYAAVVKELAKELELND